MYLLFKSLACLVVNKIMTLAQSVVTRKEIQHVMKGIIQKLYNSDDVTN